MSLKKKRARSKTQYLSRGRVPVNKNVFLYLKNQFKIKGIFEKNNSAFDFLDLNLIRYFDPEHYSTIETDTFMMCLRRGRKNIHFTGPNLSKKISYSSPFFSFKFIRLDEYQE